VNKNQVKMMRAHLLTPKSTKNRRTMMREILKKIIPSPVHLKSSPRKTEMKRAKKKLKKRWRTKKREKKNRKMKMTKRKQRRKVRLKWTRRQMTTKTKRCPTTKMMKMRRSPTRI